MTNSILIGAIVLGTAVTFLEMLVTGKTPLYWVAMILLCLEAGLRQLWKTITHAAIHYAGGYLDTLATVKFQVAATKPKLAVMPKKEVQG
jgi:hypothetical protein